MAITQGASQRDNADAANRTPRSPSRDLPVFRQGYIGFWPD